MKSTSHDLQRAFHIGPICASGKAISYAPTTSGKSPAPWIPWSASMSCEHVEDDATALRNIFNCLRPQGRAIVLVPEGPSIYGTLDRVLGHYRRYTEEELKGKMEEAGFHVERILQFNRITRPGWYWNGRILRSRRFSRPQLVVFRQIRMALAADRPQTAVVTPIHHCGGCTPIDPARRRWD